MRLGNRSRSPKHSASIYPVAEGRSYHRNLRYLCGLFAISAIRLLSGASTMTRHHKPIYTVLALVGMVTAPTASGEGKWCHPHIPLRSLTELLLFLCIYIGLFYIQTRLCQATTKSVYLHLKEA